MLGELELLAKTTHQFVNKRFTVICDNVARHTISKNDVCSDKINHILLFDFLYGDCLLPLGKIICGC